MDLKFKNEFKIFYINLLFTQCRSITNDINVVNNKKGHFRLIDTKTPFFKTKNKKREKEIEKMSYNNLFPDITQNELANQGN